MKKQLIFVDIDGTLTCAGENTPLASAVRAIRQAQANGHKVFLCTGRNFGMLAPLLVYGFDGVIGCGGGLVQVGNTVIYDEPMTDRQRDLAMEVLAQNGVFRTLEARDVAYGDEALGGFLAQGDGNSEIERWRKALSSSLGIRPMREYDGRPVYKVVIMCRQESQLTEARRVLEQDFLFSIQEVREHACLNGDLVNRKFDKGQAVERVCRYLGHPVADTVGFGDSMNDLEMLQTVGVPVCMENGSETLKPLCAMIAPRVEQDGLYRAFEQLQLI